MSDLEPIPEFTARQPLDLVRHRAHAGREALRDPLPAPKIINRISLNQEEEGTNFTSVIGPLVGVPTGTIERGLAPLVSVGGGASIALDGSTSFITFAHDAALQVEFPAVNFYFQLDAAPNPKFVLWTKEAMVPGGVSLEVLTVDGTPRLQGYKRDSAGNPLWFNNAKDVGVANIAVGQAYKLTMATELGATLLFLDDVGVGIIPDDTGWLENTADIILGAYPGGLAKTRGCFDRIDIWGGGPFSDAHRLDQPTAVAIDRSAPEVNDDTFASFSDFVGPIVEDFNGDQGHRNYILHGGDSGNWTEQSRIDARGSTWRQKHNGRGEATQPADPHLVNLGGAWQNAPKRSIAWVGGLFVGTTSLNFGYKDIKGNAGLGIQINSHGGIVDGVRIHNIHEDAIKVSHGEHAAIVPHPMSYVKNCWISFCLGDGIENDHVANLTIDDCLIDGAYAPISIDPGGQYNNNGEEANNTLILTNSLLRTLDSKNTDGGDRIRYSTWVKSRDQGPQTCPRIAMHNNILAFDGWANTFPTTDGPPGRWQRVLSCVTAASNNVVCWLPDSSPPGSGTFPRLPSGFEFVSGREARDLWEKAKQNWINSHPKVQHAPGDPASVPEDADPSFYGGGGL